MAYFYSKIAHFHHFFKLKTGYFFMKMKNFGFKI